MDLSYRMDLLMLQQLQSSWAQSSVHGTNTYMTVEKYIVCFCLLLLLHLMLIRWFQTHTLKFLALQHENRSICHIWFPYMFKREVCKHGWKIKVDAFKPVSLQIVPPQTQWFSQCYGVSLKASNSVTDYCKISLQIRRL